MSVKYLIIFYLFYNTLILGQDLPHFTDRIISPITKIIGGELADIEDYPHHVSVRVWDIHICGGSILDEKTILTAAHCTVPFDHNLYTIRVGGTNKDSGIPYQIEAIYEHPNYNKTVESDYDFSILKLKNPLLFGRTVKPIKLVDANVRIPRDATVTTVGWGVTQEGAPDGPLELRQVDLQTITNEECGLTYGVLHITTNMICAIGPGKDSCQGDSGGPLIYDGQLCGVVSFGIGCARPGIAGIYSRISPNRDWINSLMETGLKRPDGIVGSSNKITNIAQKIIENKLGSDISSKALISIQKCPYIVSLRCYDQHYCSGAILDEYTVVTTAHCVAGFPQKDLSIRVGNANHNLGKSYNISKVIVHPEFSDKTLDFNAAILKLSSKLEFDETVKFISIPSDDDLNPWSLITVIGWDNNRENNNQNDVNLLQATELRTIDNFQCGQAYGSGSITNNMFCAIDYTKDYCHSDSGGAAVFNGLLYGLVSTGESCIKPGYPGVYTKLFKFYNWIKSNLERSDLQEIVSTKEVKLFGSNHNKILSNRLSKNNEVTENRKSQVFPYLVPAQRDLTISTKKDDSPETGGQSQQSVLSKNIPSGIKVGFPGSGTQSLVINKAQNTLNRLPIDFLSLTDKIIGGQPVDIKDFPYQASLRVLDHHICGAVIISPTCLLTSAHCTKLNPVENYSIRVGNTKHALGTEYAIESMYIHPLFNKTILMDADIAMIKLKTPLVYSESVKEVVLMDENTILPNRAMFVISGWGITQDGATTIPDNLQAAVINLVDTRYCKNVYGDEQITDNMICALQNDVQTCEGDSGAPLVWNNQLVGLASFNVGCTKAGYPGVYVKIIGKDVYEWVKKICN